jgi:hypothetical protein
MPHVAMFIMNSVFRLPFVGIQRSWTLVSKGGIVGVIGGVLGIIPYAVGLIGMVNAYISLIQQGTIIPADDAGLGKPGGVSACLSWLLVALIGVAIEYLGYGLQEAFKGDVEIPEMKWE